MALSSRFAARKQKMVGDSCRDDFPPLGKDSRSSSGASSRVGGDSSSSNHGDSGALHGGARISSSIEGPSPADVRPSSVQSDGVSSGSRVHVPISDSGGVSNQNWSSLFSSEIKLQYIAPKVVDGKKSVLISKTVLDKGVSLCGDCLVGKFFGVSSKLFVIQSTMDKLWGRLGRVEVIPLIGEGFMFKFVDPGTRSWMLEGGHGLLVVDRFSFNSGNQVLCLISSLCRSSHLD